MTDQSKSSRRGLKRSDAPVDLFTLQPEPDLIPDPQVTEDEKTKEKPKKERPKRSTSRQRSSPKSEPNEKEASPEEEERARQCLSSRRSCDKARCP